MINGVLALSGRAMQSTRMQVLLAASVALALGACADDASTATDGSGGSTSQGTGGTGQGTGGAGQGGSTTVGTGGSGVGGGLADPQFEGAFWVETHKHVGGAFDAQSYGLFWEVGSATQPVEDWYDKYYGSGTGLAVGECALITQPAPPSFTPFTAGPTLHVVGATSDLITLTGPPNADDYVGDGDTTAAGALHTGTFRFSIDPGAGDVGTLTSAPMGPLVDVAVPVDATCTAGMDCLLTAKPSATVDDMLFLVQLTYVCRGDATTGDVTIPPDVMAGVSVGTVNIQTYAIQNETMMLGSSPVPMKLVTREEFLVETI